MESYIIEYRTNDKNWVEELIFTKEEAHEYLGIKGFKQDAGRYVKPINQWGSATYAYIKQMKSYSSLFANLLKAKLEPDMGLCFDATMDAYFAENNEIRLIYTPPHKGTDYKHRILVFTWGEEDLYEVLLPNFSFINDFMMDFYYIQKNRQTLIYLEDMLMDDYKKMFKLGNYMI